MEECRIGRVKDRDKRLAELKQMLLSRDYKPRVIDAAIQKALAIPRSEALKRVVKKQETDRKVFSVLYDPRLPKLSSIVTKHWRVMVNNDSRCREVYKKPPMVSFRRPPNLKDKLVRAKLPPTRNNTRPRRTLNGMRRCGHCVNCPWVVEGKEVRATATNTVVTINAPITCQS